MAFARIRDAFGDVRIGSTKPPGYVSRVPGTGFAAGQVVYTRLPPGYEGVIAFHREQPELAHAVGLDYVASINANSNEIDNLTFFRDDRRMCAIETVDFATSWQWPQGRHPQPSFEPRFRDGNPAVREEITGIPEACAR